MRKLALTVLLSAIVAACNGHDKANTTVHPSLGEESKKVIKINLLGFSPNSTKVAVVPAGLADSFTVVNPETGEVVFEGNLTKPLNWGAAGETVQQAEFSSVTQSGEYQLVAGGVSSPIFKIDDSVLDDVTSASIKAYYYNRASTELLATHAGLWARPAGHPDDAILLHPDAIEAHHSEDYQFRSPKGWYDAGDYGKYVVNSGISTYTLMAAYRDFPALFEKRRLNIPESDNQIPDLLDEVKWNLDWLQTMQDPADGGVYHKLTTKRFSGAVMPAEHTDQRYAMPKSTAAALNFAAVMAVASRIYSEFESDFPGLAAEYEAQALRAWEWAQRNPTNYYVQPDDVKTGQYGDKTLIDEFSWAAAELYLTTKDATYYQAFKKFDPGVSTPGWPNTASLAYVSLVKEGQSLLSQDDIVSLTESLIDFSDKVVLQAKQSGYGVAMTSKDFVWGSNAVVLNKALLLSVTQSVAPRQDYLTTMSGLLDYVLGRNPLGLSYVTGFGKPSTQYIHHRPSHSDYIAPPIPGFIAGGPNPGQQDGCDYQSSLPAKSYVDDWCSYASNEIAINWNAPLVYVLAAVQAGNKSL